ncbi:23S rRNA (guanosine(2251)-2'-O)-methyltransferase RlmB [uncultured Treponema sp.]|uniref:23S rRNA (guanosine(2251)-2'-O)-methyltransferase RlmB n=1 Tax=uncultured Treponema sp. TaxID=162155 RepID=UPI0025FAB5E7|nr:23S rRNA (guanosine(2251)-2'-O)-methyltransferase RlmB [uncultured Treponema sp.]
MKQVITGFHAIEEKARSACESGEISGLSLYYSKIGPRVKKILDVAHTAGLPCTQVDGKFLDSLVQGLNEVARDHRGIVLVDENVAESRLNEVNFDTWIAQSNLSEKRSTILVLDSITDPHNIGAILRSCDQFGVNLVVMPQRNSVGNVSENEIIARSSAGASAYVPFAVVKNLNRAVQKIKEANFWIYGADAGGESVQNLTFPAKTCIVMGSEGTGISRLLEEQCDSIVSIPTCGKIDSLNVSVATGVLLYERYRQGL